MVLCGSEVLMQGT